MSLYNRTPITSTPASSPRRAASTTSARRAGKASMSPSRRSLMGGAFPPAPAPRRAASTTSAHLPPASPHRHMSAFGPLTTPASRRSLSEGPACASISSSRDGLSTGSARESSIALRSQELPKERHSRAERPSRVSRSSISEKIKAQRLSIGSAASPIRSPSSDVGPPRNHRLTSAPGVSPIPSALPSPRHRFASSPATNVSAISQSSKSFSDMSREELLSALLESKQAEILAMRQAEALRIATHGEQEMSPDSKLEKQPSWGWNRPEDRIRAVSQDLNLTPEDTIEPVVQPLEGSVLPRSYVSEDVRTYAAARKKSVVDRKKLVMDMKLNRMTRLMEDSKVSNESNESSEGNEASLAHVHPGSMDILDDESDDSGDADPNNPRSLSRVEPHVLEIAREKTSLEGPRQDESPIVVPAPTNLAWEAPASTIIPGLRTQRQSEDITHLLKEYANSLETIEDDGGEDLVPSMAGKCQDKGSSSRSIAIETTLISFGDKFADSNDSTISLPSTVDTPVNTSYVSANEEEAPFKVTPQQESLEFNTFSSRSGFGDPDASLERGDKESQDMEGLVKQFNQLQAEADALNKSGELTQAEMDLISRNATQIQTLIAPGRERR